VNLMSQDFLPQTNRASTDSAPSASREAEEGGVLDCAIIGAGPAGLTALEYLARFHRQAVALGAGGVKPRLLLIDRTYNLPGYPEGIPGKTLLDRLRTQAENMGGQVRAETAERIEGAIGSFTVHLSDGSKLRARRVLLAMGVRDRRPDIPDIERHDGRFVRYCPVCDGYEHTGKHLGILGSGGSVARHALFLQTFSNRISIFLHGKSARSLGRYRAELDAKGIDVHEPRVTAFLESENADGEAKDFEPQYLGCGVRLEDATEHPIEVLYSALGCDLHLEPVADLRLDLDEDGYVRVDIDQETSCPGVYAAGDLVSQINQISVAFGQAAIAAVRIHNALDDEDNPDDIPSEDE
jgi:thioredoxin reductase (NADPH)